MNIEIHTEKPIQEEELGLARGAVQHLLTAWIGAGHDRMAILAVMAETLNAAQAVRKKEH